MPELWSDPSMTLDLEGIKKRYPDPESDIDAEPHEWADGILGEWANGGATSIRATGGNIFQAAYKDIGRIWDEWSARGDAIQSLIAEVERLREENKKLVKVLAMADVLVDQTQARLAKLERVREAAKHIDAWLDELHDRAEVTSDGSVGRWSSDSVFRSKLNLRAALAEAGDG